MILYTQVPNQMTNQQCSSTQTLPPWTTQEPIISFHKGEPEPPSYIPLHKIQPTMWKFPNLIRHNLVKMLILSLSLTIAKNASYKTQCKKDKYSYNKNNKKNDGKAYTKN